MLVKQPARRVPFVVETGDPIRITVAIRDVAVGDLEMPPDHYDAFVLLAIADAHSTIH